MARSLCSAALAAMLVAGVSTFIGRPAAAQFINPFEALFGPPPRPPSAVPSGRQQAPPRSYLQPYPQDPDEDNDPRSLQQTPAGQASYPRGAPTRGAVQSETLAPPPGSSTASADPGAGAQPALPGVPADVRPLRVPPQPSDTSPKSGDEVVAELPPQKIENKGAVFSGLDKITGRIIKFDAAVGETVQFGALQVTPRACYTRPPTETASTDAFIEVDELTLQGKVQRIFTGWMFASSPGLHAVEHPIYDVWLTDCKNPVVAAAPPAQEASAVSAPPPAAKPATSTARRTQQRLLPPPR
jgi:hypothetical protein